jgi:hypothetical protein
VRIDHVGTVLSRMSVLVTVEVLPAASAALKVKTYVPSLFIPQVLVPVAHGSEPVSLGVLSPGKV